MNFRVCMCTRTFAYFLQAFYILQAKQGHLSHVLDAAAPRNCQRVVRSSFDQSVGDAPFLRSVGSAFGACVAMHPWRCAALQMGSNMGTCVTHKALHQRRIIFWYLGPFLQSLPQFLLQFSQCYSAKLNAHCKVNASAFSGK